MSRRSRPVLDLTRDLRATTRIGTTREASDRLLSESLDALGGVIPFDLATIMELQGDQLAVRVARGTLATPKVRRHRILLERFPSIRAALEDGHARAFGAHDHEEGDGDTFDGAVRLPAGHFCMVVPLRLNDEAIGVMTLDRAVCGSYPRSVVRLADVIGKLLAQVIGYAEQTSGLDRMRGQLEEQVRLLSGEVASESDPRAMLEMCPSESMRHVTSLARQVAGTGAPVVITGETGTGKEVVAQAIHAWSRRAAGPFVGFNCAALPPGLMESELFGHVKGAFTGATDGRLGRFRAANGGTLFLDEIGEMPPDLQAKLLRVLQEGCFEPVGSDQTVRVDVRIVAATHRDLSAMAARGEFREDLYYRLAVFPIHLSPLRARRADIPVISRFALERLSTRHGREPVGISDEALRALDQREFRGNVRELVNLLERALVLCRGTELSESDLRAHPVDAEERRAPRGRGGSGAVAPIARTVPAAEDPVCTLEEVERRHILRAIEAAGDRLYGKGGAAQLLDVNPNTLRSRMQRLGIGGVRELRRERAARN